MTVKELREALGCWPDDDEVRVIYRTGDYVGSTLAVPVDEIRRVSTLPCPLYDGRVGDARKIWDPDEIELEDRGSVIDYLLIA